MKLITANKLNKFWKTGVLPIKNALTGKVDKTKVLNTKEEITANTSSDYAAGALPVKELINSLGGITFGVDADGNYGYIKAGADTVTPFKKDVALPKITARTTGTNSTLILNVPDGYRNGTLNYYADHLTAPVYALDESGKVLATYSTGNGGNYSVSLKDTYIVQMNQGVVHSGNGDKTFTLLPD